MDSLSDLNKLDVKGGLGQRKQSKETVCIKEA
jgi:hypothetical protein